MCEWQAALVDGNLALVTHLNSVEMSCFRGAFDKELNFAKLHPAGTELFEKVELVGLLGTLSNS